MLSLIELPAREIESGDVLLNEDYDRVGVVESVTVSGESLTARVDEGKRVRPVTFQCGPAVEDYVAVLRDVDTAALRRGEVV